MIREPKKDRVDSDRNIRKVYRRTQNSLLTDMRNVINSVSQNHKNYISDASRNMSVERDVDSTTTCTAIEKDLHC